MLWKCLTLASVVILKADIASPEDKVTLAEALFYLREPTTGSVEGDVKRLGNKIDGYAYLPHARPGLTAIQPDSCAVWACTARLHHTMSQRPTCRPSQSWPWQETIQNSSLE